MAGRQSKLTHELQEDICKAIRAGLTYEQAATLNGVGVSTFMAWRAKGEKAKSGIYQELVDAIKKANIEARAIHLQRINKASFGGEEFEETSISEKVDVNPATGKETVVARETKKTKKKAMPVWQASAWLLERRFPGEFGRFIQPQPPDEKDPLEEWINGLEEAEKAYGD